MIKLLATCLAAVSLLGSCGAEVPKSGVGLSPGAVEAPIPKPAKIEWLAPEQFNAAVVRAKEEGKGVMLLVTATWCAPCQKLKAAVLESPSFADALADKVIFVKAELKDYSPKGETLSLMKRFKANSFPTYVIIDKDLKVVMKKTGSGGTAEAHVYAILKALGESP